MEPTDDGQDERASQPASQPAENKIIKHSPSWKSKKDADMRVDAHATMASDVLPKC